jgi:ribosomal small subunit protein bTHX
MGKGDQRSRRGKIHRGTYGTRRPKPKRHRPGAASNAAAEAAQATKEKSKEAKVVKKQPAEAAS